MEYFQVVSTFSHTNVWKGQVGKGGTRDQVSIRLEFQIAQMDENCFSWACKPSRTSDFATTTDGACRSRSDSIRFEAMSISWVTNNQLSSKWIGTICRRGKYWADSALRTECGMEDSCLSQDTRIIFSPSGPEFELAAVGEHPAQRLLPYGHRKPSRSARLDRVVLPCHNNLKPEATTSADLFTAPFVSHLFCLIFSSFLSAIIVYTTQFRNTIENK